MLGEIAEGIFGGVFRFMGRILTEIILEVLLRDTGYLFCRMFKKNVNPDSAMVVVAGILIWLLCIFAGIKLYMYSEKQIEIDKCLDSGGKYNYTTGSCQH